MRDGDTATDWQAGRIDLLPFQQSIQKSLLGHPDSIKFVSHDRQDLIAVGGLDIHTYQIGVQKYAHVVTDFTGSEMAIKILRCSGLEHPMDRRDDDVGKVVPEERISYRPGDLNAGGMHFAVASGAKKLAPHSTKNM